MHQIGNQRLKIDLVLLLGLLLLVLVLLGLLLHLLLLTILLIVVRVDRVDGLAQQIEVLQAPVLQLLLLSLLR